MTLVVWHNYPMPTAPIPALKTVLAELKRSGSAAHKASKARLGAGSGKTLGVTLPVIRALGRKYGRHQELAEALWSSGYHEARLLAALVAEPERMTPDLVETWLGAVSTWDLCDHLCNNLFVNIPACFERLPAWAADEREFVRRAAFALMASLAIHRTVQVKPRITRWLALIKRGAADPRPLVKKAVSWALRELGKRDSELNALAGCLALARDLAGSANLAERWVGKDALKELEALTAVPGRRRLVAAGQRATTRRRS
jgi:3-methyladenine DNA glycosylase AlkD